MVEACLLDHFLFMSMSDFDEDPNSYTVNIMGSSRFINLKGQVAPFQKHGKSYTVALVLVM